MKLLKIFIASPGDVSEERNCVDEVVADINHGLAKEHGINLESVRWETHGVPTIARAQASLNPLVDGCHIFVGILWSRFGSASGKAASGTEEEYRRVLNRWRRTGAPEILPYFGRMSIEPPRSSLAVEQLAGVVRFREQLESENALIGDYNSPAEFRNLLQEHLSRLICDTFSADSSRLCTRLQTALNDAFHDCTKRAVPFGTSDVLLTLLFNRHGDTYHALQILTHGHADEIARALMVSRRQGKLSSQFSTEIDWKHDKYVQLARRIAEQEGSPTVLERHLALALFRARGETVKAIMRKYNPNLTKEAEDLLSSSRTSDIEYGPSYDPFSR